MGLDDRHFIVVEDSEADIVGSMQIHVVVNWFSELNRLVPTGN